MRIVSVLSEHFLYAGLKGRLVEVEPESLTPAQRDFYVRVSLNENHARALAEELQKGEELPPVVVAYVKELGGYRIINGNHTTKAHQILQKPLKALDLGEMDFESAMKLQFELNHVGQILTFRPEDFKDIAIRLYRAFRSELLGKKDRKTAIEKIALFMRKTERMVYNYLKETLDVEDLELKKKAFELYEKGLTQEQIAQELGLSQQTVSAWVISKLPSQTSKVESTSLKLPIFEMISKSGNLSPSHSNLLKQGLKKDFLALLDEYYMQDGVRFAGFPEWAKSKGYELDMEEWKRFADMVISALERGLVINIRKDRGFIEKYLIEELKGLGKRAREGIVKGFLGVFYEKAKKDVEKIARIVREVCEDLNVVDVKEEVRKRAKAKDNHFVKYLDLILAQYEDELSECLTKYPVLTEEEVLERKEKYLELESKEKILEEIEADYPERRIPPELAERLWREKTERVYHALKEKLSRIESLEEFEKALLGLSGLERELYENSKELRAIEKALREKEEKVILESLVEGIKALQWNSLDEMMQALEEKEKAVALKHVSNLKKAFSELPVPSDGEVLSLIEQGLEDGEILESFRGKGLYLERGRLLKIREEYLKKKEEERKRQEEELKRKEQELMQKQALIIAQQEVVEGRLYEEEEDLPEWVVEELLKEEEEEVKGISLKGVLKELENLKKQVEDIRKEVEGLTETKAKERIGKKLDAMTQRIEKLSHRVSVSLEKKKKVDVEVARFAYRAMQEFNREYRNHTGSDLPARDFKRGMQEFCRYFAEGMKMGRPAEELMQDLFDAMSAQFEKHRNSGFKKAGVAYLTPSDLIQNLARYLAIAREEVTRQLVYERVINHYREVFGNGSI